jgi:hypothetical protein
MNRDLTLPDKDQDKKVIHFKWRQLLWLIIIGLVVAGYGYYLDHEIFAWGVLTGLPLAGLNYWLLASVMGSPYLGGKDGAKSVTRIYGRSLARFIISLAALTLAMLVSAEFALGVAVALLLNMISYLTEAGRAIRMIIKAAKK